MLPTEFPIFQSLLGDVYAKAFSEPLSTLPHSKAKSLSWFVYESTGYVLSYKTLSNYVSAVLGQEPERVNPNVTTLAILVRYVQGQTAVNDAVAWYQYRSRVLRGTITGEIAPALG